MLRRKWMVPYPPPDYRGFEYWYTMRLKHGGMLVNDINKLRWIEGTESCFDFVYTRKLSLLYFKDLCEQLGYMEVDIPMNEDEPTNKKPSTRMGRQRLVKKRAMLGKVATNCSVEDASSKSIPYSVESSINAPPPKQIGVQIRAPSPMSFQPSSFIGQSSTVQASTKNKEPMKVFNEGGKKSCV